jgi:ankyrin repeat protein
MDGWKPLVYACASPFHQVSQRYAAGIVECIEVLVSRGADPNTHSALRRALVAGNRSAALALYQRGASPTGDTGYKDVASKQAFWGTFENTADLDKALAAIFEDTELVNEMNRRAKEAVKRLVPRTGATGMAGLSPRDVYAPMYPSNQDYNVMIWQLLIKRGVRPNWNDTTQDSPLHHLAMWNGDAATAEFFLANGAPPELRRADGKTPYFLAVRFGNQPVAGVLRAHGAKSDDVRAADALIGACRVADVQAASAIAREHPDVLKHLSAEDQDVFVECAGRNRLDAVRLMLEIGFEPARPGESGATALHAAAWHGHVQMIRLLLRSGTPRDIRDKTFGQTPKEWALHGSKHCRDAAEDYAAILEILG